MCSVQPLRDFIRERLTAAAEEIFSEVERTIGRFEEELDAQRKLLAVCLKPQVRLHRIGRFWWFSGSDRTVGGSRGGFPLETVLLVLVRFRVQLVQ